jgi:uncharacterized protein
VDVQRFSWHETKREAVFEQRGIDFADLEPFFDDPYALAQVDDRRDYGEARYNMLASAFDVVLNITFTVRAEVYHLISARLASRKERAVYARPQS